MGGREEQRKINNTEVIFTEGLLIIVDVQNGFINDNTREVLDVVNKAKEKLKYDVCVLTKFFNSEETSFSQILNWRRFQTDEEQAFAIVNGEEDIVIYKSTYSAVTDELKSIIKERRYTKAYVCGIETDSCVLATAFELFDNGVEPMIIIDGCASMRGPEYHNAAELIMRRSFGDDNVKVLNRYLDEIK